jgi:predicted RNase H-like HicB family nuclease
MATNYHHRRHRAHGGLTEDSIILLPTRNSEEPIELSTRIMLNSSKTQWDLNMFSEYIAAALARAEYEVIDNPEPYYAHVPGLEGVWATGETFEDCRKALIETIEEWIAIRLRHGLRIPSIDGNAIDVSTEPMAVG